MEGVIICDGGSNIILHWFIAIASKYEHAVKKRKMILFMQKQKTFCHCRRNVLKLHSITSNLQEMGKLALFPGLKQGQPFYNHCPR